MWFGQWTGATAGRWWGDGSTPPPPPPPAPGFDPYDPRNQGRPNVYARWGFPAEPKRREEEKQAKAERKAELKAERLAQRMATLELRRPRPSALLRQLLERAPAPPPTDQPIVIGPLPAPPPTVDPVALRAEILDELEAAADQATLALTLWAELHGFAWQAALTLDLMAEMAEAQVWAEAQIRRRRRNAVAIIAALRLLDE